MSRRKNKYNVLLTGGTGFVGSHLLCELIKNNNVGCVYVVSRRIEDTKNIQLSNSLLAIFEKYDLPFGGLAEKVRVIYGDISKINLGIDKLLYDKLAKTIDVVYHVAANVNHMKGLASLIQANVDSVKEIIVFSKTSKRKLINFISTVGAASNKNKNDMYTETMPSKCSSPLKMGYLESKRLGEKLLAQTDNSNIFRLGYVSGNSKTGVCLSDNNQLMMLIKSCIQLGYAPALERTINLTPVDLVSKVIGHDSFLSNAGKVLHVVNTKELISWREIIEYINEIGYNVKYISLKSWQSIFAQTDRSNALYPMKLKYRRKDVDDHVLLFGKNINEYSFSAMEAFCSENGVEMNEVKGEYLDKVFNYLSKVKFIGEPTSIDSERKAV